MSLLDGQIALAVDDAAESALARFFASLGATVKRVTHSEVVNAVSDADFLLERSGLPKFEQHPQLIHVAVTSFGGIGPRTRWRGSELVDSAMGGTLRGCGDADRPPVKEALDACWFHADMVAAAGALAAYYERGISGRGQHIDVSVQEVALSRNINSVLVWQFDKRKLHRAGGALSYGRVTVRCIWPLKDGFCFHSLMTGRFGAPANQALSEWMDEVGVDNPLREVDWLKYNRSTLPAETRVVWEAAIESFFRTRTREQIRNDGRRRGINATVLASPEDVLADEHLRARSFWSRDAHPNPLPQSGEGGSKTTRTSAPPLPVRGEGRGEGIHTLPSRFVAITPGPTTQQPTHPRATTRSGPLAGIRVLDFSWALVGSITTKILGDLGADVIKVESRTRPCLSRVDVQVSASAATSFDDKPWFAHLNSSKRSLALDMKQPASRELIDPLLEWADVVVENFSPGTMHKLGLNYDAIVKRNPGVVMVSGSVFGQTGPLAQEWGVDGTGGALSGRTLLTGWSDCAPVVPSFVPYGDVIVPYVMAASVAAALEHRCKTGRGCHIDASMYEICVQQMADAIAATARGEHPTRQGNRDARVFHQGVYATEGDDRYVAITLHTEHEWSLLNLPAAHTADERDAALTNWLRSENEWTVVERLQALGIAAGVVQDIDDLLERDATIAVRGALISLDHPLLGAFGHVRTPLTFSRSANAPYRPPMLGEHSRAIAATLCQLSEARIAELESLEIFK